MRCRVVDGLLSVTAQPRLCVAAEACASFSFRAQSSQQTSTVLPPIVTLIALASSSQSQAAQVLSITMSFSLNTQNRAGANGPCSENRPLSGSLATLPATAPP